MGKKGELGPTAQKLAKTYEQYPTMEAAAKALGVSSERIVILCTKLGITRWSRPRSPAHAAIPNFFICENCQKVFSVPKYIRSPHRFCSKRCQGQYIGKHYGFGYHIKENNG